MRNENPWERLPFSLPAIEPGSRASPNVPNPVAPAKSFLRQVIAGLCLDWQFPATATTPINNIPSRSIAHPFLGGEGRGEGGRSSLSFPVCVPVATRAFGSLPYT